MEVLKTGEELERQILEDARKKASRTLEAAEKDCTAIRAEMQAELDREAQRLEAGRDRRVAALRSELAAQLPLDFMRARLQWIDATVTGGLREMLSKLSADELAGVLGARMRAAAAFFAGRQVSVACAGLTEAAARSLVEQSMPGVTVAAVAPRHGGAAGGSGPGDSSSGVVIESTDGKLKLRCTLAELEAQLLDEHRQELAEACLGREALSDGGTPAPGGPGAKGAANG